MCAESHLVLKVGCPNLTKGHIFAQREAAGGTSCLPNLGASRWSEDVKTETWGLLILTTAGEGEAGGCASDSRQRCCFALSGLPDPCSFPGLTHTRHLCSVHRCRPCHVWFRTVSNTFQENMPATNLMNQDYTPFGHPHSQNKIKNGERRECKENRSRRGRTRGKREGCSLSLPSPTCKRHIQDRIQMKGKQRTEMCHRSFGLEFCHVRVSAKPTVPFFTKIS